MGDWSCNITGGVWLYKYVLDLVAELDELGLGRLRKSALLIALYHWQLQICL